MKKSELQQIIKEEIQKTLKEENDLYSQASDKARKLMLQLEDLALNGEVGNQDIEELRARLRSARSKMFAAKRSPDDRQASAQKAVITKKLEKAMSDAKAQATQELVGDYGMNTPEFYQAVRLSFGNEPDKKLQKQYYDIVKKVYQQKAAKATDDSEVIKDFFQSNVLAQKLRFKY